jgi:hypothetical protein
VLSERECGEEGKRIKTQKGCGGDGLYNQSLWARSETDSGGKEKQQEEQSQGKLPGGVAQGRDNSLATWLRVGGP